MTLISIQMVDRMPTTRKTILEGTFNFFRKENIFSFPGKFNNLLLFMINDILSLFISYRLT